MSTSSSIEGRDRFPQQGDSTIEGGLHYPLTAASTPIGFPLCKNLKHMEFGTYQLSMTFCRTPHETMDESGLPPAKAKPSCVALDNLSVLQRQQLVLQGMQKTVERLPTVNAPPTGQPLALPSADTVETELSQLLSTENYRIP